MWPRRIVVVGGGTAGWLAAMMLGDAARRGKHACDVTVIESSKIGTVGVGEGTTAAFNIMLRAFGIDEMEFLRETGGSIKLGICHRDWRRLGHQYHGPIDDPHRVAGLPPEANNPLDQYWVSQGKSVGSGHLFQHLINRNASPYARQGDKQIQVGPFHHAFHFDQALAGKYLRTKSKGVQVIDDQVAALQRDGLTGDIQALVLDSGQRVEGDLFIDATGFRRRLIGEMGAVWQSYRGILPMSRAMPFWLDIPEGDPVPPVTLAWAQRAGWMWKIPTQGRYGCGYVYSDAHITPDQAKAEIEAALGQKIEVRSDIKIDAGRQDRNWIGNCVAVGLSSSFVEPLEATSIHGSVVQLMLLCSLMADPNDRARTAYNGVAAQQVDDFRDFIRLHYVTERRDSPFWRDIAASHPPQVTDRLAHWNGSVPQAGDFRPMPMGLPHVTHELHIPVLDGLGLLDKAKAGAYLAARPELRAKARKAALGLESEYIAASAKAEPHAKFLKGFKAQVG